MSYGTYNPTEPTWIWKACTACKKNFEIQDWLADSRPKCHVCQKVDDDKRDARLKKLRKAGMSKLTKAEREALGLAGKKFQ